MPLCLLEAHSIDLNIHIYITVYKTLKKSIVRAITFVEKNVNVNHTYNVT